MNEFQLSLEMARGTRVLAKKALSVLPSNSNARRGVRSRVICPIDYMRYAEFEAVISGLNLNLNIKILDVSSPQWFSIYLASKYESIDFYYINITDDELTPYAEIARKLGINNLKYEKADARDMEYSDNTFDAVISISVLEHIYPEDGGDVQALRDIYRVVKPNGSLFFTVPFKSHRNVVYKDGSVYERGEEMKNFYAREYDDKSFRDLVSTSQFYLEEQLYISEAGGLFPVDYYQWGPGKGNVIAKILFKFKKIFERLLNVSPDEMLAKKYLSISGNDKARLVNVYAKLTKK